MSILLSVLLAHPGHLPFHPAIRLPIQVICRSIRSFDCSFVRPSRSSAVPSGHLSAHPGHLPNPCGHLSAQIYTRMNLSRTNHRSFFFFSAPTDNSQRERACLTEQVEEMQVVNLAIAFQYSFTSHCCQSRKCCNHELKSTILRYL